MKIEMEFDRKKAEITVAMAMNAPLKIVRAMTDEELIKKAFRYASAYGFKDLKIVKVEEPTQVVTNDSVNGGEK